MRLDGTERRPHESDRRRGPIGAKLRPDEILISPDGSKAFGVGSAQRLSADGSPGRAKCTTISVGGGASFRSAG